MQMAFRIAARSTSWSSSSEGPTPTTLQLDAEPRPRAAGHNTHIADTGPSNRPARDGHVRERSKPLKIVPPSVTVTGTGTQ